MLSTLRQRLDIWFKGDPDGYKDWILRNDTLTDPERQWIREKSEKMEIRPFFSVIMPVYNPPIEVLKLAIDSVRRQLYPDWELCIADDASTHPEVADTLWSYAQLDSRIKVTRRAKNGHISAASNSAIELAKGDWLALFDHDDELSEHALYCVAQEINEHPEVRLVYSDEDKITLTGKRFSPYFKPDWNPALLMNQNFFSHFGVYRADLVDEVGGFRLGYEGSQDYDLLLRCVEKVKPAQIRHIPRILYHWRAIPGSVAADDEGKDYALPAARRAVQDHLDREGIRGRAERSVDNAFIHRVIYEVPTPVPKVTVIIPMRDKVNLTSTCVRTLKALTRYDNFETIVIDNDSQEEATKAWLLDFAAQPHSRVLHIPGEFSFSRLNNEAARQTTGEILLFLNNDVEILQESWMTEMVGQLIQRNVAAVGARLWYPDKTLQHGGVILGMGGVAGHQFPGSTRENIEYFARNILCQNLSAVTAACLAVRRACFDRVGGFNEKNLPIQYNDVDLCLRLREAGYDLVWTPYAELIHHESRSRGYNVTPEQLGILEREQKYILSRWSSWVEQDPAYNPNLSLEDFDFSIAKVPRVPMPWRKADLGDRQS